MMLALHSLTARQWGLVVLAGVVLFFVVYYLLLRLGSAAIYNSKIEAKRKYLKLLLKGHSADDNIV